MAHSVVWYRPIENAGIEGAKDLDGIAGADGAGVAHHRPPHSRFHERWQHRYQSVRLIPIAIFELKNDGAKEQWK